VLHNIAFILIFWLFFFRCRVAVNCSAKSIFSTLDLFSCCVHCVPDFVLCLPVYCMFIYCASGISCVVELGASQLVPKLTRTQFVLILSAFYVLRINP